MPVQIPRPSIGRVVIFTDVKGDHPAVVLSVCEDSRFGAVNLTVLEGASVRRVQRVPHDKAGDKGASWRYPERVEGNIDVCTIDELRAAGKVK